MSLILLHDITQVLSTNSAIDITDANGTLWNLCCTLSYYSFVLGMTNSDLVPSLSYNCDKYLPVILKCRQVKQDAQRGGAFAMSKCFTRSSDLDCVIRMVNGWE